MKHFGTDGIRCKADEFTEEYLRKIALGIAYLSDCRKVVIGRDPRVSGKRIEKTLTKVLSENGVEVLLAGMIPTPCLAFLTALYRCDYGIMLSASHNPPEYNGVKLFASDGSKVSKATEQAVEDSIERGIMLLRYLKAPVSEIDGKEHYIKYLLDRIKPDLKGQKIVLDTANGATSEIAKELFSRTGADVVAFNTETDGVNINCGCGATVPKFLLEKCRDADYDIAFTYDGDGDRVMCVQDGKIFNGDHLMYVHCKDMMTRGELVENTMVGTVMSNLGTEKACKAAGINLVRTAVGDKCVYREMVKKGYNVGGEESGHMIFSDYLKTGDGILASLLTACLNTKKRVSEADDIVECPSVSDCIICDKEAIAKFNASEEIRKFLSSVPSEYRIVVRPSGTEPKIRILVEAELTEKASAFASEIKKYIEERVL